MVHRTGKFIHKWRVVFLVIIVIGFFYNLGVKPLDIGRFIGAELGLAVGFKTSVAENPINRLAAQLQDKADRLDAREASLNERENAGDSGGKGEIMLLWMLLIGIVLLFVLILINFTLDYRERKREHS